MDSIFWALVAIFMVLGLITVVGHVIWVILAALFGKKKSQPNTNKCAFCGLDSLDRNRCQWCGRDLTTTLAAEVADLDVVKRQLQRFREKGTLPPDEIDRLLVQIGNYRLELLSPRQKAVAFGELLPGKPQVAAPVAAPIMPPEAAAPEVAAPAPVADTPAEPKSVPTPLPPDPTRVHVAPPIPAAPPRRSWAELLAAFLEERNIHWGELVGGLLIVCSSTALVVSLWEHLKTIPYFQFFIFVTITSAIFGVGLYAHHRWKLASTSRGILIIATLLVPLNFVAMAGMSNRTWTPAAPVPQVVSLGIFAWLVILAARVIAGDARRWLALAVLGNSAATLAIVPVMSAQPSGERFLAAGGVCAGLFAVAIVGHLHRFSGGLGLKPSRARLDAEKCGNLFALLGIAAFSTAVAIGLLVAQVASRAELVMLLHRCSPLAAVLALPVLAAGLTVQRGARRDAALDSYRLAGTAVALVGLAGMLAGLGLAWPHPWWIIAVGMFDMLALGWAAFRWRMPVLHVGAIACAALAYLTAFHLVAGDLKMPADEVTSMNMLQLTLSGRSGTALGGLFVALALISEGLVRLGYRRHAVYYLGGCAIAAVVGLILTTYHGLTYGATDALRAAILYGLYGGIGTALAARWRRIEFSYLGLLLLAAVLPWGFAWHPATRAFGPHWGLLLAGEALILAAAGFGLHRLRLGAIYVAPLAQLGEALAWPAIFVTLAAGVWEHPLAAAICTTCAGAVYFILAVQYRTPWRVFMCQGLLSFASLFSAVAWLKRAGWITSLEDIANSPRDLQVCGIALIGLSLAWMNARTLISRVRVGATDDTFAASFAHRYGVDRIVRHAVVAGQFLMLVVCIMPAVQDELTGPAVAAGTAFGPAAWLLTGLLAVTLLAALWDQWREEELITTLLIAAIIPGLIAGRFAVDPRLGAPAAASALRWGLGVVLVISSAAIWQRARLAGLCRARHAAISLDRRADAIARAVSLITMAAPVLLITVAAALLQLGGTSPRGPAAPSFFANLGPTWSYLVPLVLVMAALVGHALRERSSGYAFSAGLVLELAVTLGYSLRATLSKQPIDTVFFVSLLQWATIAAAVWAIVWLVARRFTGVWREDEGKRLPGVLMHIQIGMAVAGNAILLGGALFELAILNWNEQAWCIAAGRVIGWFALVLPVVAVVLRGRLSDLVHALGGLLLGAGVLAACAVANSSIALPILQQWRAYHALLAAWTASGAVMLAAGVICRYYFLGRLGNVDGPGGPSYESRNALFGASQVEGWIVAFGVLAVGLALGDAIRELHRPWWPAGAMLALSGIAAATALWRRRVDYVYASSVLISAAGIVIWRAHEPDGLNMSAWLAEIPVSFLMVNVLCLAAGSAVWSFLGRLRNFGNTAAANVRSPLRYCAQAAWLGTALFVIAVALGTFLDLSAPHVAVKPMDWIALASIAAAAGICLWHRSPRPALQMLYCLGLAAAGMWLWSKGFAPRKYYWAAGDVLGCFTLAAAAVGWSLPRLRAVWSALRIPIGEEGDCRWFSHAQALAATTVAALAVWISTDASFNGVSTQLAQYGLAARLAGPLALLVLSGTTIVMAVFCRMDLRVRTESVDGQGSRSYRSAWQFAAFWCSVLFGCCLRWSMMNPAIEAPWLHGSIAVIVSAVVVMLIAGGLKMLLPRENDWAARGRQFAPHAAGLAGAMTFAVLAQEAFLFKPHVGAPLDYWEIAVVATTLFAAAAACIGIAVVPQWDPFKQSDRQRQVYVYVAEAIGLLIGIHFYLAMPWLFEHDLLRYWMFLVLAGAFLGAGFSEWFHRRGMSVLAVPFERTAMLLPLLPAVGFWIMPDPNGPWSLVGRSPLMWFMMALFYTTTAVTRRSGLATVLAVLAGNFGLWTVLHESHVTFFRHPQIWLIPIALAALAAEHLNRRRVAEPQRLAVRYLALSVIYVSSMADMYIAGLAEWRLALVLMVLSVAGVLLGILLRVRSFLYLGVTFLVVDLTSMIFYAAVIRGNTWVWYASGIALGVAIIALFAVFEKRRNDVLAAVERLKVWQR